MNPPVRDKAHREGIWAGVHNGVADVSVQDRRAAYARGKATTPTRKAIPA